jgi:hypothetical protein
MIYGNKQNFEGFWVKYDDYEIFEYNNEFCIKPSKKTENSVYNVFDVADELLVDFFLIGKEVAENWDHRDIYCELKSKDEKYQKLVLDFVKKYGILGEITYMPINDNFIYDNKVILAGSPNKKEYGLADYLKMFFEYDDKVDFSKELSKEDIYYLYGKNGSDTASYLDRLDEFGLTFSERYSEKISRILVYAKLMYDTFADMEKYFWEEDESQKQIYSHFLKDFKPYKLAFEISYTDKATIRWNFTSLKQAIEIILGLNVSNDRKSVKICKRCYKPFIAKNLNSDYCSITCRNVANVYKSRARNKNK